MVLPHLGVEIIMALTPQESQQMGRIEAGVEILVDRADGQEERVLKLEGSASKIKGALCILSLLLTVGCAWLIAGCAHYHNTDYYPNGAIAQETVSTVLGSGEATILDGDDLYSTRDNGLSDNALEGVEALVTVTPPAAAVVLSEGLFGGIGRIVDEVVE
jgi:hypothetical protein